ncbi:probable leucine-rich repeat receptor-like serine/threonine-protein kinase At3g14840 isoform X3 [Corylus avellana]|uniref:probable leucine-rich repeat receptor-like serine/threonine-protein kinase At3g14840 isoform X3 n=1 Tax=Corylus avellana TaxID=13451 RepID=UPI00286B1E64|nr:probable leucine-rich repeat receptor-like serine/threonine-protein kinase At3g14840 isoform X3 [Corylus avellana]
MKKKMFLLVPFLLASTLFFCFATFVFGAAVLPDDEVEALRGIAKSLGKTDWNFSVDPCSGDSGWFYRAEGSKENDLTCDCSSSNGTVCHVVSIILKGQNLAGTLPPNFAGLPYLQQIDLTRNYLNGSIPPGWGSSPQLVNISLLGNRLTGSIPKELANITTLKSFTVEFNQLSGNLPPELGHMPSIERLLLSSNYFTGELPNSFAGLITLNDLLI